MSVDKDWYEYPKVVIVDYAEKWRLKGTYGVSTLYTFINGKPVHIEYYDNGIWVGYKKYSVEEFGKKTPQELYEDMECEEQKRKINDIRAEKVLKLGVFNIVNMLRKDGFFVVEEGKKTHDYMYNVTNGRISYIVGFDKAYGGDKFDMDVYGYEDGSWVRKEQYNANSRKLYYYLRYMYGKFKRSDGV